MKNTNTIIYSLFAIMVGIIGYLIYNKNKKGTIGASTLANPSKATEKDAEMAINEKQKAEAEAQKLKIEAASKANNDDILAKIKDLEAKAKALQAVIDAGFKGTATIPAPAYIPTYLPPNSEPFTGGGNGSYYGGSSNYYDSPFATN